MSWWWYGLRRTGEGRSLYSINTGCLLCILTFALLLGLASLTPPCGGLAVIAIMTGWALIGISALATRAARRNPEEEDSYRGLGVRTHRGGLVLIVAGVVTCAFLIAAEYWGWIE